MNVRLRYSQKLQKIIDNILDDEERLTSLTCLYINSYLSITELSLLYQTTEDIIIEGLNYENVYEHKVCVTCNKLLPISEYSNNTRKGRRVSFMSTCRICRKPIVKKYIENSKEYSKKYNKLWRTKNKLHRQQYMKEYMKDYRAGLCTVSTYLDQIKLYEECRIDPTNSDLLQVKCLYCGHWFNPTNSQITSRLEAIRGTTEGEYRLYCSDNCKSDCPIYRRIKYEKGKSPATSREVQSELRKLVFARDNYTCQKCNVSQDQLQISLQCHHIEPSINNPIESADINNCITVCKNCHIELHRIPGCTYHELKCA